MNDTQALLAQLRDVHPPAPVSWWPPAPGWWIVLVVTLLIIAIALWLVRQRRAMAVHAAALRRLDEIQGHYQNNGDDAQLAQAVSILLRRFAVINFPHHNIGGLHGKAWLAFLDRTGGGGEFSTHHQVSLLEAPYRRDAKIEATSLIQCTRRWLRQLPRAKLENA